MIGPWASALVALTGVVACAGVFGASMTPATRLIFAMADCGQLPAVLARVNERCHTPVPAILLTAVAAWILAVSGSFIYLVKITLIARISVYAITCLTLPVFRRRAGTSAAGFRVPAGTAVAVGCALVCALFLAKSSMRELFDVSLAVVTGLVLFALTWVGTVRSDPGLS
jgi:amino acid transporter